ncbi:sulfotransferase [Lamprobacter modestohalophilus]|uniref:sulfotransferase family protein n=1 Tax=Lamprobacter modestohalophilus TaxID=1064514 RepID=UPI002ADEB64A|nr:sulfotransferase [Lamprobacter modestohalophilus]MEA1051614.1 sulfotransferase [Lamprobacter modestohalophilus]
MQLIVLGMHRSGTSAVTRMINMMGAYLGAEGGFQSASDSNPKGHWERVDVMQFNDALFRPVSASWWQLSRFNSASIPAEARADFEKKARNLILNLDAHRPWVLKDPRLCVLFPCWRPLLEVPVILHVFRQPIQIAQSLQQREGFPLPFGIALWERHLRDALNSSRGLPRLAVRHEDMLADPVATTTALFEGLSALEVQGLRLPSAREISAFIDPRLHRQRGDDALAREHMDAEQWALYRAVRALDWPAIDDLAAQPLSHRAQRMQEDYEATRQQQQAQAQQVAPPAPAPTSVPAQTPAPPPRAEPTAPVETPAQWLARLQGAWLQGQWQLLIALTPEQISAHPQRTRLAFYAAGAHAAVKARQPVNTWLQQAAVWEPDRARRQRILMGCLGQRQSKLRSVAQAQSWSAQLQRLQALAMI